MMNRSAVTLVMAALLAACGQQSAPEAPAEPTPVVAPAASARASLAYDCEGDLRITAVYGTDANGNPDAAIFIRGQDFQMTGSTSASGARYTTPYGLEAGQGLIWWEQDGTALLQQAPEAELANPEAARTLRTCTVKTEAAAAK